MTELMCTVQQGPLKGHRDRDINGKPFLSFHGIPYAKAPLGHLRFKDPQKPENWDGIRDATKEGNPCLSYQLQITEEGIRRVVLGSEDCLFLNVFTHKLSVSGIDLKPVMFFIHGGAFTRGSGSRDQFGPEILMTEDIVLVTINYRLGALGFLSFDDPSLKASGNAGLKDQVQALKWVKKNIKSFGGDPENITIFGESAGGAAVHFLILSPLAKGLFHKAIMQSGSALNPWTCGENSCRKLAAALGCDETDEKEIWKFLQFVPAEKILEGQNILSDWLDAVEKRPFGPSVEKKSSTALICEDPLKTILSGNYNKVPIIMGCTSAEGILVEVAEIALGLSINLKEYVPYILGYRKDGGKFQDVNKKICQFYFGVDSLDLSNREALHKLFTDILFLRGVHSAVKIHAKTSQFPVYYYKMSIDTDLNLLKVLFNLKHIEGAAHGDDLGYFFKLRNQKFQLQPGSVEEIGYKRLIKMWTNFAKTGHPIPEKDSLLNADWKAVSEAKLNFLDIGTELVPGTNPDSERMKFWDEIFANIPGY